MAKRHRHPKPEIEKAISEAEATGWVVTQDGTGHCWGRLWCPGGKGGCHFSIWSTPKKPLNHARHIRRQVKKCPHKGKKRS